MNMVMFFGTALLLLLLQGCITAFKSFRKLPIFPATLLIAGIGEELFAVTRAFLSQVFGGITNIIDGYRQYRQYDLLFVLYNASGQQELQPPVKDLKRFSDQPVSQLSGPLVGEERFAHKYLQIGAKHARTVHFVDRTIKDQLSQHSQTAHEPLYDELRLCIDSTFGSNTEVWTELNVYKTIQAIAMPAICRVTLGLPLAQDTWLLNVFSRYLTVLHRLPPPGVAGIQLRHHRNKTLNVISAAVQKQLDRGTQNAAIKSEDSEFVTASARLSSKNPVGSIGQEASAEVIAQRIMALIWTSQTFIGSNMAKHRNLIIARGPAVTTHNLLYPPLQQAINLALQHQQPAGHWVAPVSADVSFTAEYVMFKYAMEGLSLDDDGDDLRRWILATQTEDGSWTLAPDLSGNVSSSVEAYLALRLLNVPATDPAMQRARSFILSQGGIAHVRFFTRFFLASFGLIPWTAVPQMPLEVILLPTWAPLNIYVLSHWARSTLMPLLLIRHHEPVYPLPNGYSTNNDFLDELWCDPTDKMVPYTPPLLELFWGKKRHVLKLVFTLVDKLLAKLSGIRKTFLNRLAKQRCLDWILEHQEEHGDWAGYFPPIHGNVWVLLLEGYSLDSRRVRLGLEALERFSSYDENGKWFQPTVSPCWDTALMANALCDAGLSETKSLVRAADWLWDRQLMVDHGDWRIYANTQQAGGWSFEYFNTFFPDVDDTAVVIMTLVKQDPGCIESRRIINAVEWILGMQNQNGGWGAFDINNEAVWLHAVPFNDTDALVDPATADVTGRILECWALLLAHRRAGYQFPEPLRDRLRASAQKAIPFLLAKQERSGAWWGRWGCNYIYGTANVLRGLQGFCTADTNVQKAIAGGVRWLRSAQQSDGGWGETLFSYTDATLAGCGITTAAQTAWAVDCILRFGAVSDPVVERGIGWLVKNQQSRGKDDGFASWPTNQYVGTGFPKVMFVGYPFYHHHFPIAALSRYIHRSRAQTSTSVEHLQLSSSVVREILSPSVLVMALGGRDHLDSLCRAARQLKHCRVRFATHPEYRKVIESQGFEFFDVSSSPDSPGPSLHMDAYRWRKYAIEQPAKLIDMICLALTKLWYASIDFQRMREPQVVEAKTESLRSIASRRIFVADVILSGSAATVNVYAAEQLQAVLLMVLPGRELIPTSGSHTDRTIRLQLVLQRFRDYTSQVCLDIL
ncbi:MAG: hypothetical protein M1828_005809 [Chrysothrix sp. TS-e1954]|nr:MAG: hypothetical protein M1828_005809 [Chrysothrix sp. TS-e1954]